MGANKGKRYFDIETDRLVLELNMTSVGLEQTVEEVEESLGIKGLREVNKEEADTLKELYMEEI